MDPSNTLPASETPAPNSVWTDFTIYNVSTGLTALLWYIFGAVPVFLGSAAALGITAQEVSSWFFIIFLTAGMSSLILTWRYRQPIAIGWTIPGVVFLATAGAGYSFAELAGANLVAGILIIALSLLGIGERLMHWLPLPIVLGMFAGSILNYASSIFDYLQTSPLVIGLALAGYLSARALNRAWLPPVGGAVVAGLAAAFFRGEIHSEVFTWGVPNIALVTPTFSPGSLVALSVPLVILAVGVGNIQGIGVLVSQGYRPPINLITSVIGVNSIINAAFGGHQASVQRAGSAILAGEEAGPREQRYAGNLLASAGAVLIAVNATAASALLGVLPFGLVATLAGLAILSTLMDALRKMATADVPLGAFFAFAIATSSLTIFGIGSAFWALVGGYIVSLVLERPALLKNLADTPN